MKNKRKNIVLIIVLLALIAGAGVFAAVTFLNKPTETAKEEKESNIVQLLTFDSYEEVTGTKIRLENSFGKIDFNEDTKYITEGNGSIAIFPQGDYTRKSWNPYMQLDCRNTTFSTNDFSALKSITLDVYNDSDEEKEIAINFTIANYSENLLSTPTVMYTLAPNTWTECTYDVAEEIVASYFNLANARYMTIVFPDHKESKDDVVEALYFDNLYGTKYDVAPEVAKLDYNFFEGIGFEDIAEQYLVSGETAATNRMTLERVTYEQAGLESREGFGEYLMRADATGSTWPSFMIHYGELVKKGTILTFWAYIDVENEESDKYIIQSWTNAHGEDRAPNTVASGETPFNEWFQVKILLEDNSDVSYTHFNFDDFDTEESITRFGNKPVKIYLDNIQLQESVAAVNIDDNGNITLRNPLGTSTISYDVTQAFKKGETIAFDIDFNTTEELSIWVLADGKWNEGDVINELHAMNYKTWDGKRTIMAEVKKDITSFTVVVKYFGKNNLETNICTITNIRKAASRAQVLANGDVIIKNPSGDARYVYDFIRPVKKGQRIAFDIDFNTTEAVAVWLLADGKWNSATDKTNEWFVYGYEQWDGKKTIVVEATRDISTFSIAHEYRGKEDYKKNVCTISNVRVLNPDAVVNQDGSVTLSNRLGGDTVFYDVKLPVKSDEMIRMDLDFNSTEPVTVWVMAEGEWNSATEQNEFYAYAFEKWDGRRQITAKATKNADWFRVYVKYGGETDPAKKICTISNVGIEKYVPRVEVDGQGNVTLNNKFETAKSVSYTINSPAKADGKLKFTVDFNTDEALAIWVLGDGDWNKEWYAYGYDAWTGEQTIIVDIPEDVNSLQIMAQYRGEESNWVNNQCYLTDIQVLEPDVSVAPDGTVTVRNSSGSKNVMYDIDQALMKGSKLTFDVDFNVDEALAIWVLADGQWNSATETNELFVNGYDDWKEKKTITVDVTKDVNKLQIFVQYRGAEPHTQKVCTISNIMWSEPDIIEQPDGTVTIRNSAGEKNVFYEVTGDIKAGSTFSFDIAVNTTEEIGLWVLGDGSWDNEWFAQGKPIEGTQKVSLEVKKDVSSLKFQIAYRGAEPHTEKVATLSNIKIEEPQGIRIENPTGDKNVQYKVNQAVKKGDVLSFDIDFNVNEALAIWVLGNGDWGKEWYVYGYENWTKEEHISVTIPGAAEHLVIYIQYRGSEPHTDKVATIKNLDLKKFPTSATIENPAGGQSVSYDIQQKVTAGETISFDVNFNVNEALAIWVLGDGDWGKEWYVYGYDNWSGTKTITTTVPAGKSADYVQVYVQYRGAEPHNTKVCTLSNIQIYEAGTILLVNATDKNISHNIQQAATAGQTISFDVDFNVNEPLAVWILGDGDWNKEWKAYGVDGWNGKQTISCTVPAGKSASFIQIFVQYRGQAPFTDHVCTITNFKIQ